MGGPEDLSFKDCIETKQVDGPRGSLNGEKPHRSGEACILATTEQKGAGEHSTRISYAPPRVPYILLNTNTFRQQTRDS